MKNSPIYDPQLTPMPAGYICKKFGLSRTTLWRWRTRLGLPARSVGGKLFVKEADVIAFIESQSGNAKGSQP